MNTLSAINTVFIFILESGSRFRDKVKKAPNYISQELLSYVNKDDKG